MAKEKMENILFLGNSITRHGLASYWWGEWGMAADSRDRDYVHIFVKSLEGQGLKVEYEAYNFFAWEGMAHDRAEALQLLEPKLSDNLTLVVCQLGENIQSAEGLVEDYAEMLAFIEKQAPNAKRLVIGPFWPKPEVANAVRLAADKAGVPFVDLTALWGKQEFMCPAGYEVSGDDGKRHMVNHQGVLRHPGPKGHAEIARRLMAAWEGKRVVDNGEADKMGVLKCAPDSYEEVRPKPSGQEPVYKEANHQDMQHVIESLRAYRRQAVAEGRFETHIFQQQMEKAFEESGYRQNTLNKKTEILIITDSGVGDFINLSASLREIRRIYEGAHITLVCYARAKALAEACPYVDELHLNSRNFNWGDFLAAYDWNTDFAMKLLRHRFDMAFVFGTYPSAYLLAYMSGAKERISYGKENHLCQGHPYAGAYPAMAELLTIQLPDVVRSANTVDGYLGILDNFLHAPVKNRNIEVWCLPGEVAELAEIIDRKFGGGNASRRIAIGIGGTSARKHWPPQMYGELIKSLLDEDDEYRFLIIGGPEDHEEAKIITNLVGERYAADFTQIFNFRQSAGAIGMCSCYIGNDTSTMHLAAAHGLPILSPNCYPLSLGLERRSVPVVYAPQNVPVVMALPREAKAECVHSKDDYGCQILNRPHCITQVSPDLMLAGFHLLQKMKDKGLSERRYIVSVADGQKI